MWWLTLVALSDASASVCEVSAVNDVIEALHQTRSNPVELASMGFAEACSSPAGLAEAARNIANWPPEQRMLADLKAALDAPRPWLGVCLGGHRVLQKMAELRPVDHRSWVYKECDLARHGWFSEAEWSQSNGTIVISLEAGFVLTEAGVPADDVRYLVRALAGIEAGGDQAESDDLYVFEPMPDLSGFVEPMQVPSIEGQTREAGFRGPEPEVKWPKKVRKQGGSCTVHIGVKPDASVRKIKPIDCSPEAFAAVEKAMSTATVRAAREAGERVPGRFTWTTDIY